MATTITVTVPQLSWSAGTHSFGPAAITAAADWFSVVLSIPTADYETAGNSITIQVVDLSITPNQVIFAQTWSNPNGGPVTGPHGVTDPAPKLEFDGSGFVGASVRVDLIVAQAMTFGGTVTVASVQ